MPKIKEMHLLLQTVDKLSILEETPSLSTALLLNQQCGLNCSNRYSTCSRRVKNPLDHEQSCPSMQLATS
jgi:hypothetical protein